MGRVLAENISSFSTARALDVYSRGYLRDSEVLFFKKYIARGLRVLDVGCGTGRTTQKLHEHGARVVGIDLSEAMVLRARKLHPEIEFQVMDARKLEFQDSSFDVIFFSFNGIDNIYPKEERDMVWSEAQRVLCSSGIFAYSTHNAWCIPRTRFGITTLLYNLLRLRLYPHYRVERHPFGRLVQYYGTYTDEIRTARRFGFSLEDFLVNGQVRNTSFFLQLLLEKFPLYIFSK